MKHPAAALIGAPYKRGASGPVFFDCWGVVRHWFKVKHAIELPVVAVGEAGNESAMLRAAHESGWRLVGGTEAEDDVVLMRNAEGGRHIGVMIRANGTLLVLHALDGAGVVADRLSELRLAGFREFQLWRRA